MMIYFVRKPHFFIDNFYKLVDDKRPEQLAVFLSWLEGFSEKEQGDFTVSVSADADSAPDAIKKYII